MILVTEKRKDYYELHTSVIYQSGRAGVTKIGRIMMKEDSDGEDIFFYKAGWFTNTGSKTTSAIASLIKILDKSINNKSVKIPEFIDENEVK